MEESMLGQEEEFVGNHDEEQSLLHRHKPTCFNFRLGRKSQRTSRCSGFVLAIFKVCFCSLDLWGHRVWNYIPRVLFGAICVYQAVYDFHVVLSCRGFDCGFLQNLTHTENTTEHKNGQKIANIVYTTVSLAAVISYLLFISCFIAAKRKNVALVPPCESMIDLDRSDIWCLWFAFVVITALYLCSVAVFYAIIWGQPRNSYFNILATGVAAQFLAQWTAITTCHVFAVSSFALGTFAQDAFRLIRDLQNDTLDDVIRIHEDLCTVVFSTVSAYSVWFVLHWFTYGAGVVVAIIYISEELHLKHKYQTPMANRVYFGLFFIYHLYLFLLPCLLAAKITNSCAAIYEKINCTTSDD